MRLRLPLLSLLAVGAAGAALLPGQDPGAVQTTRKAGRLLHLPKGEDAFGFVIFGDRTGGPAEGIKVLEQAVADTNLLDPDLVMTVGDLIQGYNATDQWLTQMREFRGVMRRLRMPWFPVAGNHDIYWRGAGKPAEEHEGNYEKHFGPLWYAFVHKKCWFVVLYSDEPNPETGERNFNKPASQRMSPKQLAWLQGILKSAQGAPHVFVFLHHPRWLPKYGGDWERVHKVLAAAGNVTAVFAGHIHRMRFDGVRDGIRYYTLATTGGVLSAHVPEAGYLHHFNVVTVRPGGIRMATLPVGAVLDPAQMTGELSDDAGRLARAPLLTPGEELRIAGDGSVEQTLVVKVRNPGQRPIELTVTPHCHDRRWVFAPDHVHPALPPGQVRELRFAVSRPAGPFDANFDTPSWTVGCDYLAPGLRVTLPERTFPAPAGPPAFAATPPAEGATLPDRVLVLDGVAGCLRLGSRRAALPEGPMTCEGWLRARDLGGRRGFVTKTESSEWGLFVSDGKPTFSVHLGGAYVNARTPTPVLEVGRWHHVAGVYDGAEVRLYVDGKLRARAAVPKAAAKTGQPPRRTRNELPLYVGADPGGDGEPMSFFAGAVDEVRLSRSARYRDERFEPSRRLGADADTSLLLHMDEVRARWTLDSSGGGHHPELRGGAQCRVESRRKLR